MGHLQERIEAYPVFVDWHSGIASPVGVNADILSEAECGYAPRSTEEWVVALRHLLQDSDRRQRLGANGREWFAALFDPGELSRSA